MRLAVTGLATLLLLAVSGCSFFKDQYGSKLKAATTKVMLETYHNTESFAPPAPPPKIEGPFHLKTSWLPGELRFEAVTMVEPFKERGKEPQKNKGVRVDIKSPIYVIDGRKGEERKAWTYLDENEARDFDTALSFLADTATAWVKKKPDPRQEARFLAINSLAATLAFDNEQPMLRLVAQSGAFGISGLEIPASNIGEVQAKLRTVLKTLEIK